MVSYRPNPDLFPSEELKILDPWPPSLTRLVKPFIYRG